jgi:F0F1-type ATP synthase membrane subunit b/b'
MRRWNISGWAVLLGLLVWSSVEIGWAAGAGHHSEFNLTEELFRWINFIILAVALYVVLSKILPRALQDHRQHIQQAIDEAKASRATAERLLRENQQKTANQQLYLTHLQAQAAH